jgi:hypothetical protein
MEMVGSDIGLGLSKLVNRGILKGNLGAAAQGVMDILKSPASPITGWHLGREIRRAAADPEAYFKTAAGKKMLKSYPRAREFIDDLFTAGWKPNELEQDWKNQSVRTFVESVADIKAGDVEQLHRRRSPGVPGSQRNADEAAVRLLHPEFEGCAVLQGIRRSDRTERAEAQRRHSDARGPRPAGVDIRRGSIRRDEFRFAVLEPKFQDRHATHVPIGDMEARQRSCLRGAFGGQAKEFRDAFQERRAPELHRNTAWLFGMFLLTASLGYIISKSVGRKEPKDMVDYVFPQVDPTDSKVRVSLPTYFKDMVHLITTRRAT